MAPDAIRQLLTLAGGRPFAIAVSGRPRAEDCKAEGLQLAAVAVAGADW